MNTTNNQATKPAVNMEYLSINEDQFVEMFNPLANPNSDTNGYFIGDKCVMLSTSGADLDLVQKADPACVWTIFDEEEADSDCDEDEDGDDKEPLGCFVNSGFSWVNAIGYIITEKPAPANQFITVTEG